MINHTQNGDFEFSFMAACNNWAVKHNSEDLEFSFMAAFEQGCIT